MDENVRRDLILDHYQHPVHKGLIDSDGYLKVNTNNESCIDNLDIFYKIEQGVIQDICFDGEACAISTSATSMMIERLLGKTVAEARQVLRHYEDMLDEKTYDPEVLGELEAYSNIYLQPNRKRCALLPMESLKRALNQAEKGLHYGD